MKALKEIDSFNVYIKKEPITMTIKKIKQKITGVGKDVKKLEPLYIADGNITP